MCIRDRRCILSMAAFNERLKELNPEIRMIRESSQRYIPYICLLYTSRCV